MSAISALEQLVAQSFADLRVLERFGAVPPGCARTARNSTGVGVTMGSDHPPVMVDGVLHVCGPMCQHRRRSTDGFYVCLLTGIAYGQVMSNGGFDADHCIDDFGECAPPAKGACKGRVQRQPWHNLEAVVLSVVGTLFVLEDENGVTLPGPRAAMEAAKLAQASQRALKSAQSVLMKCKGGAAPSPSGIELLCVVYAELELANAVRAAERVTPPKLAALVNLCITFISRVVVPYNAAGGARKPSPPYLVAGVLYLFAQSNMQRLHVPFLKRNLPYDRHLSRLDLMVKRVTWGKRYAQAAFLAFAEGRANGRPPHPQRSAVPAAAWPAPPPD